MHSDRIFRISFAGGKDVVARIAFPTAGPKGLLTRSEVATMDFIRSRLGPRIPKVLAWDASSDNSVGCEYIIMETCDGPTLHDRTSSNPSSFRHARDIAELMSNLALVPFSQYGSIYYKEDVPPHLQARPLYAEGTDEDELSERFRIGPSVERRFYRGGRAQMLIDRGPCNCSALTGYMNASLILLLLGKDMKSYIDSIVRCEIEWIQSYSNSSEAQNQVGARHTAEQHITLLQKWAAIAPAVVPENIYCRPTLSHPDLHASNIFVTNSDPISVTSIIDWQNASVLPLFESELPKFLDHGISSSQLKYVSISGSLDRPVLPDNFETLGVDEQSHAKAEFLQVWPKYVYLKHLAQLHPRLSEVVQLPQMEVLRRAIYHSAHSWSDGLPALEQMLRVIKYTYGGAFPIHKEYPAMTIFSGEDLQQYSADMDKLIEEQEQEAGILEAIQEDGICVSQDGAVIEEDFEAALMKAEELRSHWIANADVEVPEESWPLREGKYVPTMDSCK